MPGKRKIMFLETSNARKYVLSVRCVLTCRRRARAACHGARVATRAARRANARTAPDVRPAPDVAQPPLATLAANQSC